VSDVPLHMDPIMPWLLWAMVVAALLAVGVVARSRGRNLVAVVCAVAIVGLTVSSYAASTAIIRTDQARDRYVRQQLSRGKVTLVGFVGDDHRSARVSRIYQGTRCTVTFNVVVDEPSSWVLEDGSARAASKGCELASRVTDDEVGGSRQVAVQRFLSALFSPSQPRFPA